MVRLGLFPVWLAAMAATPSLCTAQWIGTSLQPAVATGSSALAASGARQSGTVELAGKGHAALWQGSPAAQRRRRAVTDAASVRRVSAAGDGIANSSNASPPCENGVGSCVTHESIEKMLYPDQ